MYTQLPDTKERAGTALAYMTFGIWGLIWLLISRIPAHNQKDFVRFHCFQAIFVGILYMFIPTGISILFSLITQIIGLLPGASIVVNGLNIIHYGLQQLIHWGGLVLLFYCVVICAFGKYTNIPWVSQMINRMFR